MPTDATTPVDLADLRATVSALAAIERPPASAGEREAAEWLVARLGAAGVAARIEDELAYDAFAPALVGLSAAGLAAAALAELGLRRLSAVLGVAAGLGIADDISNGPRVFRRLTMRRKPTTNVVAEIGDRDAPLTFVVLAHHDAAPTGHVFDPSFQRALGDHFPGLLERIDTSLPIWFPAMLGPLLVAAGAWRRKRSRRLWGAGWSLGAAAVFADIWRSPICPGANDNATAVAALVALATALVERPVEGVRVVLVSAGSEESLQGGIRAFAARHFGQLDRARTLFLNLETIGSPRLVLLEGEGPLVMEDYYDATFRDLIARTAEGAGITLRRGMRSRASTDSVIPSRAGFPTATLVSIDRYKLLSNYHLMSDVPENVEYETVATAVTLTEHVARALGAGARADIRD